MRIFSSLLIVFFIVATLSFPALAQSGKLYTLSVKEERLPKERLAGFEVRVRNGAVESFRGIPPGWSYSIDNELNWTTKISGAIILGIAAIAPRKLNGLLTLATGPLDGIPFEVEVKLFTTVDFEKTTEREFKGDDLILSPVRGTEND